jgi:hypothetical protein
VKVPPHFQRVLAVAAEASIPMPRSSPEAVLNDFGNSGGYSSDEETDYDDAQRDTQRQLRRIHWHNNDIQDQLRRIEM